MAEALKTTYDTLSTRPRWGERSAEWYLDRWRRRKGIDQHHPGGGRIEKFRKISKYQGVTPEDVVEGRLPKVFDSEYHYYRWNIGVVLCVYCGERLGRESKTQDHVIPRCRGGAFLGRDNLEPSCRNCNGSKSDLSLLEFLMVRVRGESEGVL
jgi:5-methylcytosine-specific restriction endonuclease McrA